MKRIELTFLLSMVSILLFANRSYTLTFKKSDYNIVLKDSIVSIIPLLNDASFSDDLSAPALPYVIYRILRPLNSAAEEPNIKFDKELLCDLACTTPECAQSDIRYLQLWR